MRICACVSERSSGWIICVKVNRCSSSNEYPSMSQILAFASRKRPFKSATTMPTAAWLKVARKPLFARPQCVLRPSADHSHHEKPSRRRPFCPAHPGWGQHCPRSGSRARSCRSALCDSRDLRSFRSAGLCRSDSSTGLPGLLIDDDGIPAPVARPWPAPNSTPSSIRQRGSGM